MTRFEILLSLSLTGFETALCVFVFARHLQKRLPYFTAYTATMLVCSLALSFIFWHFGFRSVTSYYADWVALAVSVLARSACIVELCRYALRAYRGIWALAWRILGLLTVSLCVHAALDARGQPNWIATYGLTLERDIAVSSAVILIVLFLISDYYRIPLESLQKWIALGICFFCVIEFVNNTVLRDLFIKYMIPWSAMKDQVDRVNEVWNTVYVSSSLVTLGIWCFMLRKPLPEPSRAPVLLPTDFYKDLSPAVNLRLRAFNDRLQEMLKP
jgi:hypothetical protein